MLTPEDRRELKRCLMCRERGVLTDNEAAGKLNSLFGPDKIDDILAEIPPVLVEPLRRWARERPGGYYHLRDRPPAETWRKVTAAECMTLYSLSPNRCRNAHAGPDCFHEFPVLGQLLVSDPEAIARIAAALTAGVDQGTRGYRCFMPHHGVRADAGGQQVDLVIRFRCQVMEVFGSPDSETFAFADISNMPETVLDHYLRQSGVPLAPRWGGNGDIPRCLGAQGKMEKIAPALLCRRFGDGC